MLKRAEEGKLANYEELQLLLQILTRQGKFKEAHDLVAGPLGKPSNPDLSRETLSRGGS